MTQKDKDKNCQDFGKSLKNLRNESCVKYLKLIKKLQLGSFRDLVVIWNCSFRPLKLHLEYLDTDKMRGMLIFPSEIFGRR